MRAINLLNFLFTNFVFSDDGFSLTCTAKGFSIVFSDDTKFPNPVNKIKIGSCDFTLATTSETIQAGL